MSLDTPIGEESDGSIGSFIEDTNTLQPDAQLDVKFSKERDTSHVIRTHRERRNRNLYALWELENQQHTL